MKHRPKGGGVLAKSQILIKPQIGTLLDQNLIWFLVPLILDVFATKNFNFTVFTDRTKYYRD